MKRELKGASMNAHMSKPAKWLALFVSVAMSVSLMLALVSCGGSGDTGDDSGDTGTETSGSANVANPVVEVDNPEAINEQLGVNLRVPEGAEIQNCSVVDDRMGEINFSYEGKDYTYRAQGGQELEDISGLYYDFESQHEFDTAGSTCIMQYNEGGPGFVHWFDGVGLVTYSVSVNSGASEAVLTEIAELLIAEQILM